MKCPICHKHYTDQVDIIAIKDCGGCLGCLSLLDEQSRNELEVLTQNGY